MSAAGALPLLLAALGAAAPMDRVVALVPLGEVDPALVKLAAGTVEAELACTVRVAPARELPKAAWNAARKRWKAEKILEALDADLPSGAWKTLAVTSAEIGAAKGEVQDRRVDGLGDVGGSASLVSTWSDERGARTKLELHRRVADLVLHELGHTLGAGHCATPGCAMAEAEGRRLGTQALGSSRFCEACRRKLGAKVLRP